MTRELEALEEQVEKLKNAVKALASFTRAPQERLDGALSYFVRTFRSAPEGEAFDHYRAVYAAIGDPPVGTTIQVLLSALAPQEMDTVSRALVDLCEIVTRQYAEARQHAAAPVEPVESPAITEGTLESLVPGRTWSR